MNHLHQLYEPDQLIHDLTQNDLEHEYHVNSANNAFGFLGLTSSTTFMVSDLKVCQELDTNLFTHQPQSLVVFTKLRATQHFH